MMLIFETLTAEHAMAMQGLEPIYSGFEITPDLAVELEGLGGVAAIDDGKVVGIAGIMPRWEGVGMAWAWLSRDWRKHAKEITAQILCELEMTRLRRVELAVKIGYDRGEAWARRLGFTVETECAKAWGPDGSDYRLYVRLK